MQELQLHVEVTLQQALKAAAMASFVLCHLVDGIVDCIQSIFFCTFCQSHFTFTCAMLSSSAEFEVFLGAVGQNITEQFRKFCSMLCLHIS